MVMFLRRRGSTKVGGLLTCPRCGSKNLKFVETQGFDLDIYKCKSCNTPIRYMATPLDTVDPGRLKNRKEIFRGMHHKEVSELDAINRAKKQGKVYIPGIGTYRVRSSK